MEDTGMDYLYQASPKQCSVKSICPEISQGKLNCCWDRG